MATQAAITEDVKEIIQDVITKHKLNPKSEITYGVGSEVGDGYMSRTVAVDIDNDQKPVYLFLKCALNMKNPTAMPIDAIYANEIYFYDFIVPAFEKFSNDSGVEAFRNVPKCYGTSTKNILALENLRKRGFTLFEREKIMNDNHIVLVLKAFAKYHAICFAYKDQKEEEYTAISGKIQDVFGDPAAENNPMEDMQKKVINDCVVQWDPIEDKDILSRVGNLAENILVRMKNSVFMKSKYSVMTKGDCWSNNMMFHYEGEDTENPTDVMLIDWQLMRVGSVVLDLAYFFYSVATKEALSNLNYYLKVYHNELCYQIRQLGSDPDVLYPYSVMEEEWKNYCLFGYTMAFTIIQVMLVSKDEAPNFEEFDFEKIGETTMFSAKNQEEYVRRMKILTEHMLENDFFNFD